VDAVQLAKAVEDLGAGEILLNCIDNDGVGKVGMHVCMKGGKGGRRGVGVGSWCQQ
jgi:imidazole glycerol phosphate synthase subunit HisF